MVEKRGATLAKLNPILLWSDKRTDNDLEYEYMREELANHSPRNSFGCSLQYSAVLDDHVDDIDSAV